MPDEPVPDYLSDGRQGPEPPPPVVTSVQVLPFDELDWEDFERVCYRLARLEGDPQHTQLFGTRGQDQSGIDIYSRLAPGAYATYQCKRRARLSAGDVEAAVTRFLADGWALKTQKFVFCTSHSTVSTQLAQAIEEQAERLRRHDPNSIEFEVWDPDVLSIKLKSQPDLVREFFGPAWLARFLSDTERAPVQRQPDPLFRGREGELQRLTELLAPGSTDPVAPVVLSGMPGIGKTALALEFAARTGSFTTTRIDARTPLSLAAGLAELQGGAAASASLPFDSSTLLILDGVTERAMDSAIQRSQLCRVIITTIVPDLDPGYKEIALEKWDDAAAISYVYEVLPDLSAADAASLVGGLFNQTLAIVQCANLCKQLGWSVAKLLETLEAAPTVPLDAREALDREGQTLAASIRVGVTAAHDAGPAVVDLLALIVLLGPEGVSESTLEQLGVAIPLDGNDTLDFPDDAPDLDDEAMSAVLVGLMDPRTDAVVTHTTDIEHRIPSTLRLRDLALVTVEGGHYSVHPLVAHVVLHELGDLRPWLEVAIGSFSKYFARPRGVVDPLPKLRAVTDITTMARLADLCLERKLVSQPFYMLLHVLAQHVGHLGDRERALRYADAALEWSKRLPDTPYASFMRYVVTEGHAHVALLGGDAARAADAFDALLAQAEAAGAGPAVLEIAQQLSYAVAALQDRERMRRCLRLLMSREPFEALPPAERVRVRLARAHLLWRLNEAAGAGNQLRKAVSEVAELDDPPLRLTVISLAASYGDDFGFNSGELYEQVIELTRELHGVENEAYVRALISAASADIEAEYRTFDPDAVQRLLAQAQVRLDEAEDICVRAIPWAGEPFTELLAVRGRLWLHRAMQGEDTYGEAQRTLRQAIDRLRLQASANRGDLPTTLINLALTLEHSGDLDGAIAAAQEAYDLDLARYGEAHPETGTDRTMLDRLKLKRRGR